MSEQANPISNHPYERLQDELAQIIAAAEPGSRLMAEPDLARSLGVSRATLREAMRSFEAQGLIRRRQGVGTFVVKHVQVIESGLEVLESIESLAKKIHLDVSMGDYHIDQNSADAAIAAQLQVEAGTLVVKVVRVILAGQRPVAYLVDILPQNILTPLDLQEGFTGSVLDFLIKRGTPKLENSIAEIQAVAAAPEIARALQIQRGDVLLLLQSRLFESSGKIVDYSLSYFLPGYFHFHVVRRVGKA